MTIRKAMVLTLEQEQLLCNLISRLEKVEPLDFHYWQNAYECKLCEGEPATLADDFMHALDCPLLLARQLRKMMQ